MFATTKLKKLFSNSQKTRKELSTLSKKQLSCEDVH